MRFAVCRRCAHSFHGTAVCGVRLQRPGPFTGCVCESPAPRTNWFVTLAVLGFLFLALYAAAFVIESVTAHWRF